MHTDPGAGIPALLALTLDLWQVEGAVEAPGDASPVVAWVRARGLCISVERAGPGDGFRWYLGVRGAAGDGTPARRRPCGSLVGVLGALRRLLDVKAGGKARVARAAE